MLVKAVTGLEVETAAERGWEQLRNGELLSVAASSGFDAFVTIDRNMRHQQNLAKLPLTVVELNPPDSSLVALAGHVPHFEAAMSQVSTSLFVALHEDGRIEVVATRSA
jgi:hypothetical protein